MLTRMGKRQELIETEPMAEHARLLANVRAARSEWFVWQMFGLISGLVSLVLFAVDAWLGLSVLLAAVVVSGWRTRKADRRVRAAGLKMFDADLARADFPSVQVEELRTLDFSLIRIRAAKAALLGVAGFFLTPSLLALALHSDAVWLVVLGGFWLVVGLLIAILSRRAASIRHHLRAAGLTPSADAHLIDERGLPGTLWSS